MAHSPLTDYSRGVGRGSPAAKGALPTLTCDTPASGSHLAWLEERGSFSAVSPGCLLGVRTLSGTHRSVQGAFHAGLDSK